LWLRADLAEGDDQLATLRLDTGGSTVDIPVFDVEADVGDDVSTQLRLVVDGQQGFAPTVEDGGSIPQLGVWSDGVRHEVIEELLALPDSEADQKLAHRWLLDDVNGNVEDSIGSIDGNVSGVESVDGDWSGGSAGEGDGTNDEIVFEDLPISDIAGPDGFAIAFSILTTDEDFRAMGGSEDRSTIFFADGENRGTGPNEGLVSFVRDDGADDFSEIYHPGPIRDGNPHRCVLNVTDGEGTANDMELYVDQSEDTNIESNGSLDDGWTDFDLYAFASEGSDHTEAIIDDICYFDESLSDEEAQSYSNPWE